MQLFDDLFEEAVQLRKILQSLHDAAPYRLRCDDFHHVPKDQHGDCEDCPCELRYNAAMDAAKEALKV